MVMEWVAYGRRRGTSLSYDVDYWWILQDYSILVSISHILISQVFDVYWSVFGQEWALLWVAFIWSKYSIYQRYVCVVLLK